MHLLPHSIPCFWILVGPGYNIPGSQPPPIRKQTTIPGRSTRFRIVAVNRNDGFKIAEGLSSQAIKTPADDPCRLATDSDACSRQIVPLPWVQPAGMPGCKAFFVVAIAAARRSHMSFSSRMSRGLRLRSCRNYYGRLQAVLFRLLQFRAGGC